MSVHIPKSKALKIPKSLNYCTSKYIFARLILPFVFTTVLRYASAVYAMARYMYVRQSLRLLHAGIGSKKLNASSRI